MRKQRCSLTALCLTVEGSVYNEPATLGCADCTHLYNRMFPCNMMMRAKCCVCSNSKPWLMLRRYGCCRSVAQTRSHVMQDRLPVMSSLAAVTKVGPCVIAATKTFCWQQLPRHRLLCAMKGPFCCDLPHPAVTPSAQRYCPSCH